MNSYRIQMQMWTWMKSLVLFGIALWLVLVAVIPLRAAEPAPEEKQSPEDVTEDEFLKLGTEKGIGGKDWMKFERKQIKFQIEQFIPPLLEPAFTQSAFILPPNTFRVGFAGRFLTVDGNDFFKDSDSNTAQFRNFEVERQFLDFDLFYGFDLNRKYLHSFTLRVNIPIQNTMNEGFVHPNGVPLLSAITEASSLEVGDVGIFLKKKLIDQANFPFGVAMVGALFLPTGSNNEKFTNNGKIQFIRPDISGKLGFVNGNVAPPPIGVPIPIDPVADFPPGTGPFPGLANLPQVTTPFPFNNGVFNRFSDDGRLPSVLQPGTGSVSYGVGLFFTRQFLQGDFIVGAEGALPRGFRDLERWPGRSAFHIGAFHRFNFEEDGIDPGDKTTFFTSFVKPVYKDYLSLDLSFVGFYQEEDSYKGTFIQPQLTTTAGGAPAVIFREVKRPPFVKGISGFISPSLIFSPDPQIRFTVSPLIRVIEPELGPAPDFVIRAGLTVTF
ncbi:MAG: hypothetical protein ACE5G5_04025 [Candidatus Methylomirabilales bacterium]